MTAGRDAPPVLSVRGLVKRFGTTTVLDGVDLDVARGEVLVVIGASGSGKTTLLRCVNALVPYDAGSITLEGTRSATPPRTAVCGAAIVRSRGCAPTSAWCSRCSICSRI